jgi:hypothetical protein
MQSNIKKLIFRTKAIANYKQLNKPTIFEPVDPSAFNFTKVKKDEIVAVMYKDLLSDEVSSIYYNNSQKEDKKYLETFDFNNPNRQIDVIIRNTFPILNYQMLLIFDYYKLLPQYISSPEIIYKVINYMAGTEDENLM